MSCAAITPREVERSREGQEEYVVWEKRKRYIGLCRYSEYYVGRPALRTTTELYKETVFELQPDQVKVWDHGASCEQRMQCLLPLDVGALRIANSAHAIISHYT
jgi:hypothetical protein